MNIYKFALLIVFASLTGCAHQQTSYELVESVKYEKGAMLGNYRFGVTEEEVNEREYIITAKLDNGSSTLRARNMAVYHAALLADTKGYSFLMVAGTKSGRWCAKKKNMKSGQITITDGGPRTTVKVKFLSGNPIDKNKLKAQSAQEVIEDLQGKVNADLSAETVDLNSDRNYEKCWNNRF
ncbi:hypothetical protein RI844_02540 [Thalassotalea fonticola]|uniref:Lipoprotein n=1 Tax=Thalassotalea fonticola TaxID=3065649 RepID=A0ABZ0GQA1_9GAMM|nr:hypothetical protein RI844_02540 [Colwelliaceae bacterium S1-1]